LWEQERSVRYKLKLMFEWGGGTIWCDDDEARDEFGFGPVEERLPLSAATRKRLGEMTVWQDTSLDWDDPPKPSPWTEEERSRFDQAAAQMLETVQRELEDGFVIRYEPIG
jgi:hypothetical protein